jgi:hypothetical protein
MRTHRCLNAITLGRNQQKHPRQKEFEPSISESTVFSFRPMQPHGPKRIYTPQSLEFWFEKLESDWARFFSAGQLDEGRRIYRDGEVRELELTDKDAIIHRRIQKKDEYAVIEWENGRLHVRSSSTDQDLAKALAIAGLHEIEELVCDEVSPLPLEITDLPAAGPADAAPPGPAASGNGAAPASCPPPPPPPPTPPPPRQP